MNQLYMKRKTIKRKIIGRGQCGSTMCKKESKQTINEVRDIDNAESIILLVYNDGYENLKVYILPNSDNEIMNIKIAEILSEEKDAYIFATAYNSKKEVLKILQKKLKYALKEREEIEKKHFKNITAKRFYELELHKKIKKNDYQRHRKNSKYLPILIEYLKDEKIDIQNISKLESIFDYVSDGYYEKKPRKANLPIAYQASVPTSPLTIQASNVRRATNFDILVADDDPIIYLPRGGKRRTRRKYK